jgi:hypothetical protein
MHLTQAYDSYIIIAWSGETGMKAIWRMVLTVFMGLVLTVGMASHVIARQQTKSVQQQLIGTWHLVYAITTLPDGTKREGFGGNTQGILMLDRKGNFSIQLMGDARRKFASNSRLQGTPEENKGVAMGSIAYYGTLSIDDATHTVTLHVANNSFSNWDGTDQKRIITKLAGDDLTWSDPATSMGGTSVNIWKRTK